MPSFTKVNPGDPIQSHQLNQVIDALIGTAGQGVPLAPTAVNDATNYALTVQNDEAGNSRALNVLKSDGTTLIKADASGVTLGSPLNLPANSITSAAIADAGITNAKLGPDVARANLLTNGGFEIWQRGNGPFATAGVYTADRWLNTAGSGATVSTSRILSTIGHAGISAQVVYTHAAGGFGGIQQKFENWAELKGQTITFAVQVKSSVVGSVILALDDGVAQSTSSANATTGSERLTLTKTLSGSGTQLLATIYCHMASANATVEINDATLVVGSQPADYVPMHPADDLARCQRYYEFIPTISVLAYASATGQGFGHEVKLVQKAVTPTVTTYSWGNTNCSSTTDRTQVNSLRVTATSSGSGAFEASGGLQLESNP